MAVVRKVQSKIVATSKKEAVKAADSAQVEDREDKKEELAKRGKPKKFCHFCRNNVEPRYWDTVTLRRYLSDRGRINLRSRSGCCAKHQRRVGREIKRARHLALLPYTVRV